MLTDSVDQEFRAQQGSLFSVSLCMEPQVEHLEAEDWHHLKTFTLMLLVDVGWRLQEGDLSFIPWS